VGEGFSIPHPTMRLPFLFTLLALAVAGRAATYTVTTTADSGAGSLRDAIQLANANPGQDRIEFATTGVFATAQTITLGGTQLSVT
jgi:hypothetical protein